MIIVLVALATAEAQDARAAAQPVAEAPVVDVVASAQSPEPAPPDLVAMAESVGALMERACAATPGCVVPAVEAVPLAAAE